ncbi:ATP-grasp domain-containing protein [Billgrantia kenyensis]|uniref:ATP-grasp domain-containing protein n=1 Tax=Billgrantia kenyensis TaxID=321266 RepID=A0A7V9W4Y5_9GAMM|nr:ATP-grasp domain-containing protein [Halomonas kenyensis]MBA2781158.1 ATP-grasp domain-containing protein [Halomonas kenyensis]MCG6663846.1 ATP-grasp domain-containing protein [Halomonas kenyensis]
MNVLLTSVGRRCYLVEYFKQELAGKGHVIGVNSDPLTSGMAAVDRRYTVPPIDDDAYIPRLLEICQEESIGLMLSLFDIDLPILARHRDQFEAMGISVVVSDPWVVEAANDKWLTYGLLLEHGLGTPLTFLGLESARSALKRGELDFPVIVKPRWGMGSISIYTAEDMEELEFFYRYALKNIAASYLNILARSDMDHAVIVQEKVQGQEYGVDVLNDLDGNFLTSVVKKKIAMRSGETDIAVTEDNELVRHITESLGVLLKHRGSLDVDIIFDESTGDSKVIEFNARFGGGYPFSHLAGANFVSALLSLAQGQLVDIKCFSYIRGVQGVKAIVPTTLTDY